MAKQLSVEINANKISKLRITRVEAFQTEKLGKNSKSMHRHELDREQSRTADTAGLLLEVVLHEQLRDADIEALSEAMHEPLRSFSKALLSAFNLWKPKVTGSIQLSDEKLFELFLTIVDKHLPDAERMVEDAVFIRI